MLKGSSPRDRLAVLVAAAAVGVLALAHLLTGVSAAASRALSDPVRVLTAAVPAVAGVVLAVVLLVLARQVAARRTLRSRVRVELLPSEEFDPAEAAVLRFASQLPRTRRLVLGWLDRRASAVRLLLEVGADGLVHYVAEAPRRVMPELETALGVYDQLEIVPVEPDGDGPEPAGRVVRAELVLARSASLPLAQVGLDPDPLQSLAVALARLNAESGEQGVVAVDLLPVTAGRRRRLQRRLLRQASREQQQPTLGDWDLLGGGAGRGTVRRADVAETLGRRVQTRGLDRKLTAGGALFELQLLLRVRARTDARARGGMQALLACFDAFAGENHLRAWGLRLGGLGFLGSDLPWRRHRFDKRAATGWFAPRRRNVISAGEIVGLLKPPTVHCTANNVARSGGVIPPPPVGLPTFTGQRDLIPLGRVGGGDGGRLVGVPAGETFFAYMAGRTRYGKTETGIGQFVHLVRSGHGGLFLDPHADAIHEIKTYLTDPGIRERVVEIDLSDPDREAGQPAWNLFALSRRTPGEATSRVEAFVDALAAGLGWDERNTRALNLATQAAQALVELSMRLPADLAPTIFQVPTILSDPEWRETVLPYVSSATAGFFRERFPRLASDAVTAVTNVIDRLHAARPVAALLGAPISSYDAQRAIRDGLIVLACPGSGSTRDRLVANLLVYDLLHAFKARAQVPAGQRRPFWLFLDELQTYDGPNLPVLLEQSGKYGGRAFLFNQSPERLSEATWNAVTTNRSHLLSATVNAKAAGLIAREWAGQIQPGVLLRLERFTYLAQITLGRQVSKPFLVNGVPARELHAEHRHPDQVPAMEQAAAGSNQWVPVAETLQRLDRHEQRITEWLQTHQPHVTDGEQPAGGGARRLHTNPGKSGRS